MRYGNADFVPVVLGTGLNAYNIARSLHQVYGVRSLALGRVALRETAASAIVAVRTPPGFESPDAIIAALLAVADELPGRKLLLIPTIEYYTNVVIDHADALAERFVIPLVDRELADRLIDKTEFYATCAALGVPHPRTVIVTPSDRGDATLGEDLPFPYPVILKPSNTDIYPRLHFAGKQKVYLLDDAAAVRETAELIFAAGYDGDLILQDYLAGDESVMRVVNTYSGRDGKLRVLSTARIVLATRDPGTVGNYTAALTVHDEELTASLRALLDGVGYVGAANFDVMVDSRDGAARVLELNLRLGAASFYAMAAGANIPAAIVEDWIYGREPAEFVATRERLWVNLPACLALMLAPRGVRGAAARAALKGARHTLWYRRDAHPRRLAAVARVNLRTALTAIRFAKHPLGG